jgi:hypothetical protein
MECDRGRGFGVAKLDGAFVKFDLNLLDLRNFALGREGDDFKGLRSPCCRRQAHGQH